MGDTPKFGLIAADLVQTLINHGRPGEADQVFINTKDSLEALGVAVVFVLSQIADADDRNEHTRDFVDHLRETMNGVNRRKSLN